MAGRFAPVSHFFDGQKNVVPVSIGVLLLACFYSPSTVRSREPASVSCPQKKGRVFEHHGY
jgi:hypothetical protein